MNASAAGGREHRVLLLPATRRDGEAIAAFLGKHQIACDICTSAALAAKAITESPGVLLLTDQVLIEAGSQLVSDALASQPSWSDIPVVFMSKVGEETHAMSQLIGRMTNVTLLDRPASTRTLLSTIEAALRSRAKQYQIRDQLIALGLAEHSLRESDQRKNEFLAMLAHELRNPLAPITTAVELLPRLIPANDPRSAAALAVVRRQVQQLTRLVDDLLDVSRITQGRIEIQHAAVELSVVVGQALESVDPQIREKKHSIHTSITPGLYVLGDGARLVQCVSNILTNAVKYTDAGGEISVTVACENAHAVITIKDNGVGIPVELLPRVFELFVQDKRSLDRAQGGLGIGLSVVRRLIEMQGGSVTASSAGEGRGWSFTIALPSIPAPLDLPVEKQSAACAALRVLIVDDNEDAADSLAALLGSDGHTAHTVYRGEAAIEAAPSFDADLILLDIGLPSMDGYEVAKHLRTAGFTCQLVALTGYGTTDDIDRALSAGFDAHLVKPVDFEKLAALIRSIIPHGRRPRL